jgi:hypothetical protein
MSEKFLYVKPSGTYGEKEGFEIADHIDESAGPADSGKPVVLNNDGKIDPSMVDILWTKKTETATASSVTNIDLTSIDNFISLDYIYTIWTDDKTKVRSAYMRVIRTSATDTKDSVHGRLRVGMLNVNVNVNVVAGQAQLQVTNNETFNVNVEVARLQLGG